jgi:hypothetical protein
VAYHREAFHLGAYPGEEVNRLGAYRLEAFLSEVADFRSEDLSSLVDPNCLVALSSLDGLEVRDCLSFVEAACCLEEVLGSIK